MDTKGQHLIIDAFECQSAILNNAEQLKELLSKAIEHIGMEILSTHFHSFSPQGVTGVIGISTSHFSIHTCRNMDMWLWICIHVVIMRYGLQYRKF